MRPWKKIIFIFLLIVAICVTFFNLGKLSPSAGNGSFKVMPIFAIQSNGNGIAYEYSETSVHVEQWRYNVTTNHKGGTFCGTRYSKEMAIFNQVNRENPSSITCPEVAYVLYSANKC